MAKVDKMPASAVTFAKDHLALQEVTFAARAERPWAVLRRGHGLGLGGGQRMRLTSAA